jgi:hypothetical protein
MTPETLKQALEKTKTATQMINDVGWFANDRAASEEWADIAELIEEIENHLDTVHTFLANKKAEEEDA